MMGISLSGWTFKLNSAEKWWRAVFSVWQVAFDYFSFVTARDGDISFREGVNWKSQFRVIVNIGTN
jgi:hypothetical protein